MMFCTEKWMQRILSGLILLVIGSVIFLSWVPPVDRDALTHHLFVPKLYLKHGGIYEIPNIPFSYYPMNLDLLYLIPLFFKNDIFPKLIHFIFALLTAWLVYEYLKKRIGSIHALLGALFFLSIPVIVKLSITVYVDLGLIFFTTASLMLLFKWLETSKARWLFFSAVMCGLALGTKYNGFISLLLLTLFIPSAYLRYPIQSSKSQMSAIGYAVFFFLISLTVFSPWMIRNYLWTQNPIYPLYNHLFNSQEVEVSTSSEEDQITESINVLKPFALRKIIYGENWWQLITIPIRIFFEGKDDDPKYFDGKLNPFLLLLPLFLFIGFKDINPVIRFEAKFLALFALLFLLFVTFQSDMRIRYASPMIPPITILSIMGFKHVKGLLNRHRRTLLSGTMISSLLAVSMVAPNALYIISQFHYVNPFPYISGKESRDTYIEIYRPEYRVIRFVNENLPAESKILFLFIGNRGYYSDREIFFGYDWLMQKLKEAVSHTPLLDSIKQRGVTHLLVRSDAFLGWINQELPPELAWIMANFINEHARHLYSHSGYRLYAIIH